MNQIQKITSLVQELNEHRNAYYNLNAPTITDKEYDQLFDELQQLETETGFILSNSPTQTVGYYPVSSLSKVQHPVPLLSLEKTKQVSEITALLAGNPAYKTRDWIKQYFTQEDQAFVHTDISSALSIAKLLRQIPKSRKTEALLSFLIYKYTEYDLDQPFQKQYEQNNKKLIASLEAMIS